MTFPELNVVISPENTFRDDGLVLHSYKFECESSEFSFDVIYDKETKLITNQKGTHRVKIPIKAYVYGNMIRRGIAAIGVDKDKARLTADVVKRLIEQSLRIIETTDDQLTYGKRDFPIVYVGSNDEVPGYAERF